MPTLLDKVCEESRTSIEVVHLLLEMTTFLEELPSSTTPALVLPTETTMPITRVAAPPMGTDPLLLLKGRMIMTLCHDESCSNPTASSCAMPKISSAGLPWLFSRHPWERIRFFFWRGGWSWLYATTKAAQIPRPPAAQCRKFHQLGCLDCSADNPLLHHECNAALYIVLLGDLKLQPRLDQETASRTFPAASSPGTIRGVLSSLHTCGWCGGMPELWVLFPHHEVGGIPSCFGVHKHTFCDASRCVCRWVTVLHWGRTLFWGRLGHESTHRRAEDPWCSQPWQWRPRFFGGGAGRRDPLIWRRRRQTGMIMRMATISLKPMQKMGLLSSLMNLNWTKSLTLVDLNGMKKSP